MRRLPFLLSCQHLLCGQCVQEHAGSDAIVCEHCQKATPLARKEHGDATVSLNPSYYLLGMMARMQEELQNIQQYRWTASDTVERDESSGAFVGVLAPSEINTPRKMKALLAKAFHAHEISKLTLDKRAKALTENVDQVVQKVTAHFVSMHNTLQLEEERVLRAVRKSFLEHLHYKERLEQRLLVAEERLKDLTTRAKRFKDGAPIAPVYPAWQQLMTEVKLFLESEPLKLLGMASHHAPVTYTVHERFQQTVSKSYNLNFNDPGKSMPLVPVTCHGGVKKHPTAAAAPPPQPAPSHRDQDVRTTSIVPVDYGVHRIQAIEQSFVSVSKRQQKDGERKRHNSFLKHRGSGTRERTQHQQQQQRQQQPSSSSSSFSFSMVKVTCIENPHEFYVQEEQFIDSTLKRLEDRCQAEGNVHDATTTTAIAPDVGSLYLVRPNGSEQWYRAKCLKRDAENAFRVQYVDYGRREMVRGEQIRPISKELSEGIAHGAIRCGLYNVVPPSGDADWPQECVQVMQDFIAGQAMVLCKLSRSPLDGDGALPVDLFLPPVQTVRMQTARNTPQIEDGKWGGYYAPMSLRSMLWYLQQCDLEESPRTGNLASVEQLNQWLQSARKYTLVHYRIPSAPQLREYDSFDVRITHSASPDHFHIVPEQWKTAHYDLLRHQLMALCREKQQQQFFMPYVGLVCAFTVAKETDNVDVDGDLWLRGRVQKVFAGACEMLALDTGEVFEVCWEDMRLLAAGSAPLLTHALAIPCRLDHVHPKRPYGHDGRSEGGRWNADAVNSFQQITCSGTLRFAVQIGHRYADDGVYNVLLYLRNTPDRETCVNGMLVASGYAVCDSGREEDTSDRARVMVGDEHSAGMEPSGSKNGEEPTKPKAVKDPRVPVDVLKIVSPSELYVRICSRAAGLVQLHATLQQHMVCEMKSGGTEEVESPDRWSVGDMCVVLAAVPGEDASAWYRARIVTLCEPTGKYEAFLIDLAITVTVPPAMVARLTARFAQIQPGAIRCRLACIEPIGRSATWHKSTLDLFRCMIESYRRHAITLDAKTKDTAAESLSVVLWGIRQSVPQALAPSTTEYRNLNQLLVVRGLAHSSGRFRTFATKGSGAEAELETLEQAIAELQRTEFEQMQQFVQRVIAPADAGPVANDGGRRTVVVNGRGDTHEVMVDGACAAALALVDGDVSIEHIEGWPKARPIEKTVFVGIPTSVGNDGTIFLYDICQEPVLDRIRNSIAAHVATVETPQPGVTYRPNDPCLAKYHLDGNFYRATVLASVGAGHYRVLFVDYGNEEICAADHLLSDVICGRVPIQTSRFRLSGIKPKKLTSGQWPDDALDVCHGLFVQKSCTVRVDTSLNDSSENNPEADVLPCRMTLLKDSVDVSSVLIDLGQFVSSVPRKDSRRNWKERKVFSYAFTTEPAGRELAPLQEPPVLTAERRELLRFMRQIEDSKQSILQESNIADPNEIPETTVDDFDWMNQPPLDKDDADDETRVKGKALTRRSLHAADSPTFFDWDGTHFETSSRLSQQDDPNDDDHDEQDGAVDCTVGEGLSRGFNVLLPIDRMMVGFFADLTVRGAGLSLHVYPHLEGHTHRMTRMAERIQQAARSRSADGHGRWQPLHLKPGTPCLAPYRTDGMYYRAIVEEALVEEEPLQMRVLYIDYMNRDTVPASELRRCPTALRQEPLRNVEVRLVGVRPSPRLRANDVYDRLEEVLKRPFYVKIVRYPKQPAGTSALGGTVVPEVQLYTDCDCSTLLYQKMIDESYFYVTSTSSKS